MAGVKRSRDGVKVNPDAVALVKESPYVSMFEEFKAELDEHQERRERVIKASRDITASSKKVIFALQRVTDMNKPIPAFIDKDTARLLSSIKDSYISIIPDLQGLNAYRYQRQVTGGNQEFLEAVLFQHYLQTQTVMSPADAETAMPAGTVLDYSDYALGLFDMTGELMRFSMTFLAKHQRLPGVTDQGVATAAVLADMQEMRSQLEVLNVGGSYALSKDFEQKMKTTRSSVEKVESGTYNMIVRGKERPAGWIDAGAVDAPREFD